MVCPENFSFFTWNPLIFSLLIDTRYIKPEKKLHEIGWLPQLLIGLKLVNTVKYFISFLFSVFVFCQIFSLMVLITSEKCYITYQPWKSPTPPPSPSNDEERLDIRVCFRSYSPFPFLIKKWERQRVKNSPFTDQVYHHNLTNVARIYWQTLYKNSQNINIYKLRIHFYKTIQIFCRVWKQCGD